MSLHVLIIEDELTLARNIATFLRRRAIQVEIANTLGQATERLQNCTEFDVVLLDVDLPDGDGWDYYRHIQPSYPELRMIAMSGRDLDMPDIATRKAGGISFLAKPFALSRILDVLQYVAPVLPTSTRSAPEPLDSLLPPLADMAGQSVPARHPEQIRIVVYSHDTYGLGNIRRMLAITQELVTENSGASVLMLSGSPMLHSFRLVAGIDYVKLPSLSRDEDGYYDSHSLEWDYSQLLELRADLITSAIGNFRPDLILVDKNPLGIGGELEKALSNSKANPKPPKVVLLLRDILDSPTVTRDVWNRKDYHRVIANYYDRILVVGEQRIFDVAESYGFPGTTASKVKYCGYIAHKGGHTDAKTLRSALNITDEPLILVSAGGGADGLHLLSCFLECARSCNDAPHFRSVVFTGPELAAQHSTRLEALAKDLDHVYLREFTTDMMGYMRAADLSISMGGYNTVCELLTLNKNAIIVPRIKPGQEQWIRAERMSKIGLFTAIHPEELTPARLLQTIDHALEKGCPNVEHDAGIILRGLPETKNRILELIE